MLVTCSDLGSFLINIERALEDGDKVGILYVDVSERGDNPTVVGIDLQIGTVVETEDEREYLLKMGMNCGIDYRDASQELNGSKAVEELMSQLESFCTSNGLEIRPGILDF